VLRRDAVKHIEENKEVYKFYIEDDVPIEDYLQDMSRDGIWGGQLEMTALSEKMNFNVIVH
jgi:hypothetical protein